MPVYPLGTKLETTDGSIILRDIPKDETVLILLPYSDASSFHAMVSYGVTVIGPIDHGVLM
jgi:hypothetical protein